MFTVQVRHHFDAPIEKVFECVSDHQGYARFQGCQVANLLRCGEKDKNGVGAVREVVANHIRFVEDIPVFEPPALMEYRVLECHLSLFWNTLLIKILLKHHLGRLTLASKGKKGTDVEWISQGEFQMPLIAGLVERVSRKKAAALFLGALKDMAKSLEGGSI